MYELPRIPDALLEYFGGKPIGAIFSVRDAVEDPESPVAALLKNWLATVPGIEVEKVLRDERFRCFNRESSNPARAARIWLLERVLEEEIPRVRYETVASGQRERRPSPYDVPAIVDVEVDDERLAPLAEFEFDGSRLIRRDHAFLALATTPSPNSTYWLLHALYDSGMASHARVRLDPLLHGPAARFMCMAYRMWIYGQPLDWNRIAALREPEHGRWQPESALGAAACTEFVWEPRGPEVHLTLEELPPRHVNGLVASRYAHAVFVPSDQQIIHLDGAVRLYRPDELRIRYGQHVRAAGKSGLREKVFRLDSPIDATDLSAILQAFFVWNEDVASYFNASVSQG